MTTQVRELVERAFIAGIIPAELHDDHIKKALNGANKALKYDAPFIRVKDLINLGKEYIKVTGNGTSYNDDFLGVLGLVVMTQRTPKFGKEKFAQSVGARIDKNPESTTGKWIIESTNHGLIARIQLQAIEKGKLLDDSDNLPSIKKQKELVANTGT